jgi:hypothetical protein
MSALGIQRAAPQMSARWRSEAWHQAAKLNGNCAGGFFVAFPSSQG